MRCFKIIHCIILEPINDDDDEEKKDFDENEDEEAIDVNKIEIPKKYWKS